MTDIVPSAPPLLRVSADDAAVSMEGWLGVKVLCSVVGAALFDCVVEATPLVDEVVPDPSVAHAELETVVDAGEVRVVSVNDPSDEAGDPFLAYDEEE